jgi:hypothetical protein
MSVKPDHGRLVLVNWILLKMRDWEYIASSWKMDFRKSSKLGTRTRVEFADRPFLTRCRPAASCVVLFSEGESATCTKFSGAACAFCQRPDSQKLLRQRRIDESNYWKRFGSRPAAELLTSERRLMIRRLKSGDHHLPSRNHRSRISSATTSKMPPCPLLRITTQ